MSMYVSRAFTFSHETLRIVNLFCMEHLKTTHHYGFQMYNVNVSDVKPFTSHPKWWKLRSLSQSCSQRDQTSHFSSPDIFICKYKTSAKRSDSKFESRICRTQPRKLAVSHELQLDQTSILGQISLNCFLLFCKLLLKERDFPGVFSTRQRPKEAFICPCIFLIKGGSASKCYIGLRVGRVFIPVSHYAECFEAASRNMESQQVWGALPFGAANVGSFLLWQI